MISPNRNSKSSLSPAEILERPPPHNLEAEQYAIAAAFLDPRLFPQLFAQLPDDAFHDGYHRLVWNAMRTVHVLGKPMDPVAVLAVLASRPSRDRFDNQAEEIGGKAFLGELIHDCGTVSHAEYYAQVIRECWVKRNIRHAAISAIQAADRPDSNPDAIADALNAAVRELATGNTRPQFELISAAELCARDFSNDWIIPGLLVRNQNCLISGVLKTCKTKISCYLAYSVAVGGEFFCKPVYQNLPVLLSSVESGAATIKQNLQAICRANERDLANIENLYFAERLPRLNVPREVDSYRYVLEQIAGGVWIADPWYLFSGLSASDSANISSAGERLSVLGDLAREFEITPILVAHNRKPGKRTPEERRLLRQPAQLADVAGAGLPEWARSWIIISRKEEYGSDGIHDLWLNCGSSAGASCVLRVVIDEGHFEDSEPMQWRYKVESQSDAIQSDKDKTAAAKKAKDAENLDRDKRKVLDAAAKVGPACKTKIKERAGLTGNRFNEVWFACVDAGEIVETCQEKAGNGRLTQLFALPKTNGKETTGQRENNGNETGVPADSSNGTTGHTL